RFAGQHVSVIGAGQSALESATLVAEAGGRATVIARKPALRWNEVPVEAPRSRWASLRNPTAPLCGRGWTCMFHSYGQRPFHLLPSAARRRIVATTFGPAGAWWL